MTAVPRYMVVTAWLAGGLGAVQAAVWAILCCIAFISYDSCGEETAPTARGYFYHVLVTHYLKGCSEDALVEDGLLDAAWVRIWVIISLSFSLLWLVLSAGLITAADTSDEVPQNAFQPLALTWSAATAAVAVIDITTGTLFAIDYARLNDTLSSLGVGTAEAYAVDMLRLAAFVLMALCLKGFVLLLANIVLAVVMAVFGFQAGKIVATSEHSVHTRGVLRAYTSPTKQDDPWRRQQNYDTMMYERGSHVNRGFENGSARSWQEPPPGPSTLTMDIGRGFDRSDSWHPVKQLSEAGGSRPFSYLEESRARGPPEPPSPAPGRPWPRGDAWDLPPPPPPPVPAPDYTPNQTRKLKSALKPNY